MRGPAYRDTPYCDGCSGEFVLRRNRPWERKWQKKYQSEWGAVVCFQSFAAVSNNGRLPIITIRVLSLGAAELWAVVCLPALGGRSLLRRRCADFEIFSFFWSGMALDGFQNALQARLKYSILFNVVEMNLSLNIQNHKIMSSNLHIDPLHDRFVVSRKPRKKKRPGALSSRIQLRKSFRRRCLQEWAWSTDSTQKTSII